VLDNSFSLGTDQADWDGVLQHFIETFSLYGWSVRVAVPKFFGSLPPDPLPARLGSGLIAGLFLADCRRRGNRVIGLASIGSAEPPNEGTGESKRLTVIALTLDKIGKIWSFPMAQQRKMASDIGRKVGSPNSRIKIVAPAEGKAAILPKLPAGYYVYSITVSDVVRYIGKGKGLRLFFHIKEVRRRLSRDYKLENIEARLQRHLTEAVLSGAEVIEQVIVDNLTEKEAYKLEYDHLREYVLAGKREQLWNVIPPSIRSAPAAPRCG